MLLDAAVKLANLMSFYTTECLGLFHLDDSEVVVGVLADPAQLVAQFGLLVLIRAMVLYAFFHDDIARLKRLEELHPLGLDLLCLHSEGFDLPSPE